MIAGLLFIPTTIFDMIWGVRYLQEARGFEYAEAVIRSSTVPLGWIIGCPLLGLISDRMGRRKPVIIASAAVLLGCLAWVLHGPANVFPPYVLGILMGLASGAAMLPYTVIKEANTARRQRHRDGRGQLPELHVQRAARPGVRLDPARGWRRGGVDDARALPDRVPTVAVPVLGWPSC